MKRSTHTLRIHALFSIFLAGVLMLWAPIFRSPVPSREKLASRTFSLENRHGDSFVNSIFRDNILLTLAYTRGTVQTASGIEWNKVIHPFRHEVTLQEGEVFAFHNDVFVEYKNTRVFSTNAHFNAQEGFKSDGYLFGDGVCHLASMINWVAREAGLEVKAPVNHDFAVIPDVPREYGTSIYSAPGQEPTNAVQNLYVKNIHPYAIKMLFDYNGQDLSISFEKVTNQSPVSL